MGLDLLDMSAQMFTAWLLVCARLFGLFTTMPMFGERSVPWQVKVGLSLFGGFLLVPAARSTGVLPADDLLSLGLAWGGELLVGIALGYFARLLFGAFQFAVNALDFQTGLSFAEVVNPTSESFSVTGQFLNTLLLLLFLELNGHHLMLRALARAVALVPLGGAEIPLRGGPLVAEMLGRGIALSLQLVLPAIVVLLLIDLAFGLIGRVVPQLNVFLAALPVKILVGLTTLSMVLPVMASLMAGLLDLMTNGLGLLVRMMH
jgi:flagellar biosynthetic protein FliR